MSGDSRADRKKRLLFTAIMVYIPQRQGVIPSALPNFVSLNP
jgi:hypothetical protein